MFNDYNIPQLKRYCFNRYWKKSDNEKIKANELKSRLMLLLRYSRQFSSSLWTPLPSPQRYQSLHLEMDVHNN